jgi:glycosyltransferase involved in cell wall biosynthesis
MASVASENVGREVNPVRVACYYPWIYLRSGVERTILETVKRSRHEWTIYTNHYDRDGTYPEFAELGVIELSPISVTRSFANTGKGALKILLEKLPMNNHDVLIVHSEGIGDLVTFRNHKKPVVCYCHQPLLVANEGSIKSLYKGRNPGKAMALELFGAAFRIVDRLAWKNYSHKFVTSQTVCDLVTSGRLAKTDELRVLQPGVDCEMIQYSNVREPVFLAFSRLKWWKNVELSIKAFKLAQQNGWIPGFRLVVAGQVDAGSINYFHELVAMAKECPYVEVVSNPTAQMVHSLYKKCYAVVNCTLREAWGVVPLEANAYGKPVLAVNQGGTAESQIHGVTGWLANPTPLEFALGMQYLAGNPDRVQHMAMAARENALKYDWRAYASSLDNFLDKFESRGPEVSFSGMLSPASYRVDVKPSPSE